MNVRSNFGFVLCLSGLWCALKFSNVLDVIFRICRVSVIFYDLCYITCTMMLNTSNNSGWIRQECYKNISVWNCHKKDLYPTHFLDTHFAIVIFKKIFDALKILYIFYLTPIFVRHYDPVFFKICIFIKNLRNINWNWGIKWSAPSVSYGFLFFLFPFSFFLWFTPFFFSLFSLSFFFSPRPKCLLCSDFTVSSDEHLRSGEIQMQLIPELLLFTLLVKIAIKKETR